MRTLPVANLRNLPNRDLALVLLNLLICIAVMIWTGLQDIAGGPQNYFNAMVYFGITSYSMLEARWSKQSGDSRNADLWFNCAWVCSAAGVVHHTFWLLLWPTLPESFQVLGGVITLSVMTTGLFITSQQQKKGLLQQNLLSRQTDRLVRVIQKGLPRDA